MKLTLEEIQSRVDHIEQERRSWVDMAKAWEKMYCLDAGFKQNWRDAVEKEGREQVTLPDPLNIVNLAKRLISTTPRIDVPPRETDDESQRTADKIKGFLTAMWQRVNWQQGRIVLDDAIWYTLVRGRCAGEVKWIKDDLPKMLRKKRFPILIRTLDPLNVGVKRGPLYTEYAFHKYETDRVDARQRYPKLKQWKEDTPRNKVDQENNKVTITDFWYTDSSDGSVWNAILVDDEFAKRPVVTDYPYIPIVETYGDSAPSSNKAYEGMSILHGIEELWPYKCRLASNLGTGVLWAIWPFFAISNENGQIVDDITVRPGATVNVPPGTRFDSIKPQMDLNMLQAMLQQIDMGIQQSAFPNVMYGDAGNMQAGYGINILSDAARGRIKSPLEYLEMFVTHVNELVLALIDEFQEGKDGIELWGRQEGTEKLYKLCLYREDIDGYYENAVTLRPVLPSDDMQRQTLGVRLADGKYISKQTLREKYLSVAMPEDEQDRIFAEMALENPDIMKNVTLVKLMELFPTAWEQLIIGTPLEQVAQQLVAPAKPPEPPPMPPMGPMPPPEMMGGGMPPMGGPPPPIQPDAMTGPMGGGIPPQMQGQLTPEAMGLPPGLDPAMFAQMMGQPMGPGDELAALAGGGLPPGMM